MDLSTIKPDAQTIEIKHPGTGMPLGVRVSMVSIQDERLKRFRRKLRDDAIRLTKRGKSMTAEQEEENGRDLAFTATTGWEWYNPTGKKGDEGYDEDQMPSFNGSVPEFNKKNFNEVTTALPWFLNQMGEVFEDDEGFFSKSSRS